MKTNICKCPRDTRRLGPLALTLWLVWGADAIGAELEGFDCLIQPHTTVEVSTREQGTLEELLVGRGDLVTQGQPIAHLERSVEQVSLDLARARAESEAEIKELKETLAFARRERGRMDKLSIAKAVSYTEKDRATTEAVRAKLKLEAALERQKIAHLEMERSRRLLANRTIHSPVDGVVVEQLMSPGESAENRPIVKIARVDPLHVEIIVPVEAFGAIRVGMRAEVSPRYPGAMLQRAEVTVVDQVLDAASDTFGVRLELPNPDFAIPGGVRCGIRFLPDQQ